MTFLAWETLYEIGWPSQTTLEIVKNYHIAYIFLQFSVI